MTNNEAVDELVEHVANKIDILINNAGLAVESSAMKGGLITRKTTSLGSQCLYHREQRLS